ncbi:MAG TPA: sulfatase-like hydrolase/transferase [Kiritimatiellia bacterium]|nr:sulfatase-like hydrolase/transferase [Kiritimatiellia bacterium]HPS07715.1 sulfatase-like hydrolase/transferase [Kiritimatiellia bacterium]
MFRNALFALALLSAATAPAQKPNIVVFVADDMGFADCGVTGCNDIPTPNIDALAKNGVRFTQGYTSGCVCSPTRAGLLTGRYQQRFGFDANAEGQNKAEKEPRALDIKQTTLPQRLKALGYATGMVGKWHLGAQDGYLPNQRGFDFFYGILPFGLGGKGPHGETPPPVYRNAAVAETPKNHMEAFCSEALAFVDAHQKAPFFLYLPFTAVHAPFVGPQPWLDRHDAAAPASRRTYGADLRQMDDIVGRVMARLRERGLEENTLVFFFSDNGGPGGAADNTPFRGTKWTLWEGGIHVPFVAQWKGRIPAGRVLNHPVIQVDVVATALAAAGAEIASEWKLDGANLLPLMEGRTDAAPHEALYWRFGVQYAVRQGDWKLVKAHIDQAPRLHNLAQDPGEQTDLAAQNPDKVKQLQALWDAWNAGNEPPRWIDNRWNGDGAKPKKHGKAAGKKKDK